VVTHFTFISEVKTRFQYYLPFIPSIKTDMKHDCKQMYNSLPYDMENVFGERGLNMNLCYLNPVYSVHTIAVHNSV